MKWQTKLSWEDAKKRASIISGIRQFFANRNIIEVETPLLSQGTVTDVYLDCFNTNYQLEGEDLDLYLQTSPEFSMKRLIASGYESIYQISKAFRNEDKGHIHNPEFTMLEWYRTGFNHHQLIQEVSDLLITVLGCHTPEKVTYQQVFLSVLKIDPLTADLNELKALIRNNNDEADWLMRESDKDLLLQFIFASYIEPHIGRDAPVVVYDFPSSQASLAQISSKDNRVAERFEVYFKGIELANGFNELTNADEQLARFKQDNKTRRTFNLTEKPIDKRFIYALHSGLPACAGVALGMDRLIMLALDKQQIDEVITFSIERA